MFKVPIVLLIFRRVELTKRVIDAIAVIQPETLLIAADGPRDDHPEDAELCERTRAAVDAIEWKGKVLKRYSPVNLGCGHGPASGISWAFQHVDRAIILEDDCLPDLSFFSYCEELLERYLHDRRVMHIAGSTLQAKIVQTRYSYRFSRFNVSWGWATWRRAWKHFDITVKLWPEVKHTLWLSKALENERAAKSWAADFERAYIENGKVNFWDYQWAFACWVHSGLAIIPRVNLVTNIGCGTDATHTHDSKDRLASLPAREMTFPLKHPPMVLRHHNLDRHFMREILLPRVNLNSITVMKWLRSIASLAITRLFKSGRRKLGEVL